MIEFIILGFSSLNATATNTTPNDHPMTNQLNSHRRVYNSGDSTAMSGSVDSASGSVDLKQVLSKALFINS